MLQNVDNFCRTEPDKQAIQPVSLLPSLFLTETKPNEAEVEQSIYTWLDSIGVRPETPSLKKQRYFDQQRRRVLCQLSGWTADSQGSDRGSQLVSPTKSTNKQLVNTEYCDTLSTDQAKPSLLSRRGFAAGALEIAGDWSPCSDNKERGFGLTSKKLSIMARRNLRDIEPLGLSLAKQKSSQETSIPITGSTEKTKCRKTPRFFSTQNMATPTEGCSAQVEARARHLTSGVLDLLSQSLFDEAELSARDADSESI